MPPNNTDGSGRRNNVGGTLKSEVRLPIPKYDETPKYVRVICAASFFMLLFIGLLITAKQARGLSGFFIKSMLVWLFLAAGVTCAQYVTFHIMDYFTSKHALLLLNSSYAEEGFNEKLPQYALSLHPLATTADRLLALYLTVMAEDYSALPPLYMKIEKHKRSERQEAMLNLCKIREQMMNGRPDRAIKLFDEQHLLMDAAYDECPDLISQRVPRSYTDDALCYYETAAGFCTRLGMRAEAEHYRNLARFRISRHEEDEQPYLEQIFDIALSYASGNTEPQHLRAVALEKELKEKFQLTQRGKYLNLKRRLDQAAIFLAVMPPGTEDPDIDRSRFARRLPGADYRGSQTNLKKENES